MAEHVQVSLPDGSGAAEGAERSESVRKLIDAHGRTFAEEAGIALANEPGPLWQLLVRANLLSARIRSDAALSSARELWKIGCDTPDGARATSWQQRVDALGRGGYRRYDFSTSTRLGANASLIRDRWSDDLRGLLREAENSSSQPPSRTRCGTFSASEAIGAGNALRVRVAKHLQEFDGVGPAGAGIVLREVQGVWPQLGPCSDAVTRKGAEKAGLSDLDELLNKLDPPDRPRLCAALVRVSRGS